jgi:hypothetical protein
MIKLPLLLFVDFLLTVGEGRVAAVQAFRAPPSDEIADFYRPLREALQRDPSPATLDALLDGLADSRKRRIFPELVAGYRTFLAQCTPRWFAPPRAPLQLGPDLEVDVAPDVGLDIDGTPTAVSLYFHGEPLTQRRTRMLVAMMRAALGSQHPNLSFAVLDVKHGRLATAAGASSPRLATLCRAEAACFASLHAAL